ncbi:unnamed protein product [Pseudo-nitzschia multistriata]|uniref:Uncharacterized protein n=1 Tax=Pseudo-nitzschia multistriata TaxID=183589 RepID=A0A448ZPC1_9STRA|nr:unnamed protein product [Pseudo-nitzschia multistriata]
MSVKQKAQPQRVTLLTGSGHRVDADPQEQNHVTAVAKQKQQQQQPPSRKIRRFASSTSTSSLVRVVFFVVSVLMPMVYVKYHSELLPTFAVMIVEPKQQPNVSVSPLLNTSTRVSTPGAYAAATGSQQKVNWSIGVGKNDSQTEIHSHTTTTAESIETVSKVALLPDNRGGNAKRNNKNDDGKQKRKKRRSTNLFKLESKSVSELLENDQGRAIVVLSMGKNKTHEEIAGQQPQPQQKGHPAIGNQTQLSPLERFVFSARNIAKFRGWIVVVTDAPSLDDLEESINAALDENDANTLLVRPRPGDLLEDRFHDEQMAYFRLKTFALDYIDMDPRLDGVRIVYYMDEAVLFGSMIHETMQELEFMYGIGRPTTEATKSDKTIGTAALQSSGDGTEALEDAVTKVQASSARGKMWMFRANHNSSDHDHAMESGHIVLDRNISRPCLDRWRREFDEKAAGERIVMDQRLLSFLLEEEEEYKTTTVHKTSKPLECSIQLMEQAPYADYPSVDSIRNQTYALIEHKKVRHPPMVHTGNVMRMEARSPEFIRPYLQDLLRLRGNEKDEKDEGLIGTDTFARPDTQEGIEETISSPTARVVAWLRTTQQNT